LDKKGRYAALQLFGELYWADRSDGGNRKQLFLDTAERIRATEGIEQAKIFMSGLTNLSIKQFLEVDVSGRMYLD